MRAADSQALQRCAQFARSRVHRAADLMSALPTLDPGREIDAALLAYRHLFGFVALFSAVINLLMLVPPIFMMQVFDRVLTSRNHTTLLMLTIIALGLFALSSVVEWIRGQVTIRMSASIDARLGERVFSAAFQRSLSEHSANPSQVLSDLATVRQFATGPGLLALLDSPWLVIYLILAFAFHAALGAFTLVGISILLGLAVWNEVATRKGMAQANQLSVTAAAYVNSTLRNAEAIQAMGMLEALRGRWAALQRRIVSAQLEASQRGAGISAATRWVRTTWQSLSLALGALLVLQDEISPGVMIAVSVLLSRAMAPVEVAIGSWKQLGNARSSYQRLARLLEEFPRSPEPMPLPAPSGAVRIERLVVIPPGAQQPAVNGLDLTLAKGEVLAVVGPSASGKSSLARAIVGIWPAAEGCVRLDEADVRQWPREAIGPYLGYLPQDVELLGGSIAENIARFGALDSAKVIEAAQLAGIHEMVLHLPQGYDTVLGQGGLGLSGGQKQRIGLARALYGQPPLIVLDEPDSSLDQAGEAALVRAIGSVKAAGSTVLLITHRMSLLGAVDKLLFMRQGAPQLVGPKDQVLKALAAHTVQPASAAASAKAGAADRTAHGA